MRYTTIIDITEIPAVYRCQSARILYIHMALRAGYHDNDRDLLDVSLRRLADGSGLSISAVRHGLQILERAGLIKKSGSVYAVRKWIAQSAVTPRALTKKQERAVAQAEQMRREREQRAAEEEAERRAREEAWTDDKTPFMRYYESLMEKAAAGDEEAARGVERHREMYEMHKQEMQKKK